MKKNIIRMLLISNCLFFMGAGCEKAPKSTLENGVLKADTKNSFGQSENTARNNSTYTLDDIAAQLSSHYTKEFSSENNCLYFDADVEIPDHTIDIYRSEVVINPWSETEVTDLFDDLKRENMVTGDELPESYEDTSSQIRLAGIDYSNIELEKQNKSDNIDEQDKEGTKKKAEKFSDIMTKAGVPIVTKPLEVMEDGWDGRSFWTIPVFQGVEFATGFPTTGTCKILNEVLQGTVSFLDGEIINFHINERFQCIDSEVCQSFASWEDIEKIIEKAIASRELIFSKKLKATRISLKYIILNNEKLQMLPVWNVEFDKDSYYHALEENSDSNETISMMNLCINALDGSIVYAS